MRIEIKVEILRRNQVDGHVVAVFHLLAQNQVVAQTFNAVVSLHRGLLCDDEVDASGGAGRIPSGGNPYARDAACIPR